MMDIVVLIMDMVMMVMPTVKTMKSAMKIMRGSTIRSKQHRRSNPNLEANDDGGDAGLP